MAGKRANMPARWSSLGWSGTVIVIVLLSQRKVCIVDNGIAQRQPPQDPDARRKLLRDRTTLAMLLAAHHWLRILDG
jgi:hypothetical protein